MTTFNDLIEEVSLNLEGFTLRQERSTYLTAAASSSTLELSLASGENIGKGIIEVDDELVHVNSVDRTSNVATLSPYGRGYRGSVAASHSANARVTVAPSFPRISVKRAINDTLRAIYPSIYGVATTTFTFNASVNTYNLPTEAETVLAVSWSSIGPSKEWYPVRRWRHDPMANATAFAGGNSITINEPILPGRTIQVVYAKTPTELSNLNDVFTTVTGLEETSRDVVVYGASYRLASFVDPGRLTFTSPESDANDTTRPFGTGTSTAKYLQNIYQQRLQEEANRLSGKYPVRVHYL